MHVLHWIATEAEDVDDAFGAVTEALTPAEDGFRIATWSDWHIVGGGRWSNSQYTDSKDMILSYKEQPLEVEAHLGLIREARVREMEYMLEQVREADLIPLINDYIENDGEPKEYVGLTPYIISKTIKMLYNDYTQDSYFYDMSYGSATLNNIEERIATGNADNIYLVPVDFHY